MVKFIGNWMFVNNLWKDAQPSPMVINTLEILHIDECYDHVIGNCVIIHLKNKDYIPIEGNIIDVLAEFQKHLQTIGQQ